MKRKFIVITIASLVLLVFSGCGSKKTSENIEDTKTNIANEDTTTDDREVIVIEEIPEKTDDSAEDTGSIDLDGARTVKDKEETGNVVANEEYSYYTFTVPNLIGKKLTDAANLLSGYDFNLTGVSYEFSDSPEGTVISQTPEAGSTQNRGVDLELVVSKGTAKCSVPNVIGMNAKDAISALENAGLIVKNEANGVVSYQSYSAGTPVVKNTVITIK